MGQLVLQEHGRGDMLGYSEQEGDSRTAAKRPTVPPNAPLKFAANTSA